MDWNEWFIYDETSPTKLRWKVEVRNGFNYQRLVKAVGDVAGLDGTNNHGYVTVGLKGKVHTVHKVVWEMHNGPVPDGFQIDHENRDKSDNRIGNLRLVTCAVNQRNKGKSICNTSGVVGVRRYVKEQKGTTYTYWRAYWTDSETGKWVAESFAVHKLGEEEAFRLACQARTEAIARMNRGGAGYTEHHGN